MASKKVFITGVTGYIGGDGLYALHAAQPDWEYSVLVRSEVKGEAIKSAYPQVKLVIGSLDDSQVIQEAASKADIVLHTADSSDHKGAAHAIAEGLRAGHSKSNPGYWIHVSGTGILCWYDMDNERYGEPPLPEQAYDDLEGVSKVTSLPDTAFHRDVDKIVLVESGKNPEAVKVAIVCPPTIYGIGRGPGNQRSRQLPGLIDSTFKKGFAPKLGTGKTEWDHVHVHDLASLFVLLSQAAASPSKIGHEKDIWGPTGYHFAESGTHVWGELSELIATEAYKQGLIAKNEAKNVTADEAKEINGFEALSWGLNSKGKAKRARKYLGWEPTAATLKEALPGLIRKEASETKS